MKIFTDHSDLRGCNPGDAIIVLKLTILSEFLDDNFEMLGGDQWYVYNKIAIVLSKLRNTRFTYLYVMTQNGVRGWFVFTTLS